MARRTKCMAWVVTQWTRLCSRAHAALMLCRSSESGSAMIEAAITIPPTILLVFTMIDAGRMLHNHHKVAQIVSDTLLYASGLPEIEDTSASFESGAYKGCAADAASPQCSRQRMVLFHARSLIESTPNLNITNVQIESTFDSAERQVTLEILADYNAFFPPIWKHVPIRATGSVARRI